jgi:poly(3-hydroxybutyrate) depolymerase
VTLVLLAAVLLAFGVGWSLNHDLDWAAGASSNSDRHTDSHILTDGRTFLLHVGPRSATPEPLVVALHSAGHSATQMESTGLSRFADRHHFVVVYGEGLGLDWNAGGCCGTDDADDVAYLSQVVAATEQLTPIDRARVYVIGMSNGAMMAYRAVCEEPQIFAAAGVVAGALMPGVQCSHTTIHVVEIHGTADRSVPLAGGIGFEHVDFPAQSTDLSRVGPGSSIALRTWAGAHSYPSWANATVWKGIQGFRLTGSTIPG